MKTILKGRYEGGGGDEGNSGINTQSSVVKKVGKLKCNTNHIITGRSFREGRGLVVEVLGIEALKGGEVILDKTKDHPKRGYANKRHDGILVDGLIAIEALGLQIGGGTASIPLACGGLKDRDNLTHING